jgi:hypothetical protein
MKKNIAADRVSPVVRVPPESKAFLEKLADYRHPPFPKLMAGDMGEHRHLVIVAMQRGLFDLDAMSHDEGVRNVRGLLRMSFKGTAARFSAVMQSAASIAADIADDKEPAPSCKHEQLDLFGGDYRGPQSQTPEQRDENGEKLEAYREVKPVHDHCNEETSS